MKGLMIAGLSAAVLSLTSVGSVPVARADVTGTQPFDLVELAYRGYFKEQGIPSYRQLVDAYRRHNVTEEDVVQAGVDTHRVSADALDDRGYLNAVRLQLRRILIENNQLR